MSRRSITIVGASLAGLRAAESLRRREFEGPITLIGDESHMPYDRPPLSKQFLTGEWDEERLALTKPENLAAHDLDFRLGTRATGFDLPTRRLSVDTGESLEVDGLLIATGARCRTLPGVDSFIRNPMQGSMFSALARSAIRSTSDSISTTMTVRIPIFRAYRVRSINSESL